MKTIVRSESDQIAKIAREYRERGYRTVVRPSASRLPMFLRRASPDLIAYGDAENVVVEIKYKQTSAGDPRIKSLAKAVESHPGWRFELVQVAPERKASALAQSASEPIDIGEAKRRLKVARSLSSTQPEVALLVGWTVIEGAVRALFNEIWSDQPLKTSVALKQAYSSGWIGWREFEQLIKLMEKRNVVAHGMRARSTTKDVAALIDVAERVISQWHEQQSRKPAIQRAGAKQSRKVAPRKGQTSKTRRRS